MSIWSCARRCWTCLGFPSPPAEFGPVRPRPLQAQTAAVADTYIGDRRAARTFLHDAVLVSEGRDAQGLCGSEEGRRDGAWIGSGLNEELAAATAPLWIRNAVPVLDAPVDVEYVLVIPRVVAGFLA